MIDAVVIGASAGGLTALGILLPCLPVHYNLPVIVVQHSHYESKLMGVILTGASADGARGLMKIKSAGDITVVQDPRTTEAEIMPKSAISACEIDFILPLEAIGKFLARLSDGVML